jgi:ribosomal-protein-alanine N-acetyltransferase
MNPEIVLESERLLFRQHVAGDIEAYCAMDMDPDVRRYIGGSPRQREEAEKRFKRALEPVKGRLSMWATIYKPTGAYVGRCGIYPHFNHDGGIIPGEASLGLYIAKEYWGRGFATEAGRAFIELGFNELEINRIVTMVQVGNYASVRVLEKLGFELVRTENGEHRSFYHFGLRNPSAR